MATKKKLLQAAAGSAGGAGGLDITSVFSTYLYSGNSSAQTITNGIDLDGEGGLWWLKRRSGTGSHALYDSTRSTGSEHFPIFSNNTSAEYDDFDTTPTSTGFTINSTSSGTVNETGQDYASWTFRKAPKFFDIQTWSGNDTNPRVINHNLSCQAGLVLIKDITGSGTDWFTAHHSEPTKNSFITTGAFFTASYINTLTSSSFTLGDNVVNSAGREYVAYIFAHNDGDGDFGPDGDQDIIKCGSFVQGTGSYDVDLGFEPQWVLIKSATSVTNWMLFDNMRGLVVDGNDAILKANTTAAEENSDPYLSLSANGFTSHLDQITGNQTYIYIAIRRGPLAPPEDATEVFDIYQNESTATVPGFKHPFPVDFAFYKASTNTEDWWSGSRLTQGRTLRMNTSNIESSASSHLFDYMNGWSSSTTTQTDYISWAWRRAPGYFDALCYKGTGANRTVSHNLNASPDLIWLKSRETVSSSNDWWVYCSAFSNPTDTNIILNSSGGQNTGSGAILWNSTAPTDSTFSLGTYNGVNQSGKEYIAYLFSTLAGVSKVGSYAGSNSDQTIDCGFTSGARFVLIKNISRNSDWIVLDHVRGIVSGSDPFLRFNDTAGQNAFADYIDPDSSGFIVTGANSPTNQNGDNYIFYAIA